MKQDIIPTPSFQRFRTGVFALLLALSCLTGTSSLVSAPESSDAQAGADERSSPGDDLIRKSIVRVKISSIQVHYGQPWIREPGESFTVLGLVVPGDRIMVLASDIRTAGLLEVTGSRSYRPVIATVDRADTEANLALLKVDDPDFFKTLSPLKTGRDPLPGDSLTAVKVDDLFRVYRESIRIKEVNGSADFGQTYLPTLVFRSSEPFQSGGLLFCGDALCGFIGYANREKRAESIPVSVFSSFYEQARGQYRGFPSQGFFVQPLVDPVLREYYGLKEGMSGVMVTRVLPGTSSWGVLEKEDILLSINGSDLDDRGYYEDPMLGRQNGLLLVSRSTDGRLFQPGDTVPVTLIRKGNRMTLSMKLRANEGLSERIPSWIPGQPPFLVESGFVFLELSIPYLQQAYGSRWQSQNIEFSYLFETERFYDIPGNDRIVFLSQVFPDEVNRGFETLRGLPVRKADGHPVRNLSFLRELIRKKAKEGDSALTLELSGGQRIFLDLSDRSVTNARILQRYGIPAASSWDLDEMSRSMVLDEER